MKTTTIAVVGTLCCLTLATITTGTESVIYAVWACLFAALGAFAGWAQRR